MERESRDGAPAPDVPPNDGSARADGDGGGESGAGTATITYWGGATVEVRLPQCSFCFDPYFNPPRPVEYAFITHEHYDHFHEPTLHRLAESGQLRFVAASRSCYDASTLLSPTAVDPEPEDLRWLEPHRTGVLYPAVAAGGGRFDGPTRMTLGSLDVLGVSSGENPLMRADGTLVSADYPGPPRAGFYGPMQGAPLPTVGYVVTDTLSGCSFYHPGDIEEPFSELSQLRGRVTVMLLPIGKLHGAEAELVNLVRPRVVVPVHYYLDVPSWPLRWSVLPTEIEYAYWESGHPRPGVSGDDPRYLADIDRLVRGHWYPSPPDPIGFLRDLAAELSEAEIALLEAGRDHRVDLATGAVEEALALA